MVIGTNSYLHVANYNPNSLVKLENALTTLEKDVIIMEDLDLISLTNNMIIKIGFMLLAKEYLRKNKKRRNNHIIGTYHIFNFIYDTKAFLDAVSMLLNQYYRLGYSKGNIDLKKESFLNSLNKKSPKLKNEIEKHHAWIKEVILWRESVIHRLSPIILTGTYDKKGKFKELFHMPTLPKPFFDLESLTNSRKPVYQEILIFCENWINHAKKIFEVTCDT